MKYRQQTWWEKLTIDKKERTMHKALHPRDDVDRLYMLRKEGRKVFANSEDILFAFSL